MHIFRQLGVVAFGQSMARVLYVASLFLVARLLGAAQFGEFMEAFALAALFTNLMDFGLTSHVTREVAGTADNAHGGLLSPSLVVAKCVITTLFLGLLCVIILYMYPAWSIRVTALCLAVGFAAISLQAFVEGVYFGLGKPEITLIYTVGQRLLFLILCGASVFVVTTSWAVAACYALSALVAAIAFGARLTRDSTLWPSGLLRDVHWRTIVACLWQGSSLALLGFMTSTYGRIDTILLGRLAGAEVTGVYTGAYRCLDALLFVGMIYRMVIYPIASRFGSDERHKLMVIITETLRATLLLILPATIMLIGLVPMIIALTLGPQYLASQPVLTVLILSWPFGVINNTLLFIVLALRQDRTALCITLVATCLNVGLNYYYIPSYGAIGAAYVTMVTEICVSVLLIWQLARHNLIAIKEIIEPRFSAVVLVIVLAMIVLLQIDALLAAVCGIVLLFIAMKWLRLLNPLEQRLFNRLIKWQPV